MQVLVGPQRARATNPERTIRSNNVPVRETGLAIGPCRRESRRAGHPPAPLAGPYPTHPMGRHPSPLHYTTQPPPRRAQPPSALATPGLLPCSPRAGAAYGQALVCCLIACCMRDVSRRPGSLETSHPWPFQQPPPRQAPPILAVVNPGRDRRQRGAEGRGSSSWRHSLPYFLSFVLAGASLCMTSNILLLIL